MEITQDEECIEISNLQFETSNPRIIIAETISKSDEKPLDSRTEPTPEINQDIPQNLPFPPPQGSQEEEEVPMKPKEIEKPE